MGRGKKIFIFTDIDLDGAMSYLLFLWFRGTKYIPHISCRVNDFNKTFTSWLKHNDPSQYDNIYILDLDVSQDSVKLVDLPNVVIIDHHDSHVTNKDEYKHAKVFIKQVTSCARHIFNLLHSKVEVNLTDKHKHLVLLVDDYDCYKLQVPGSHELNLLYWNYQGDKVKKFAADFNKGFTGFTDEQNKIVKFYKKKIHTVISELEVFQSRLPINDTVYKFVSTFATACINDVADHIINKYEADVGIVINPSSNKISFRKNKQIDLDLSKLAKKLTGGGGHSYAAGGQMTDDFLTFSKVFQPIK